MDFVQPAQACLLTLDRESTVSQIVLTDIAEPCCVNDAREVPFPLFPTVKDGLDRMLEEGITC